jgi:ribosome modulation factor
MSSSKRSPVVTISNSRSRPAPRDNPRRPTYAREIQLGRKARLMDRWRDSCPFGMDQIGRRMAWLAGWEDAHNELGFERC